MNNNELVATQIKAEVQPAAELDVTQMSLSDNLVAAGKTGLFIGACTAVATAVTYGTLGAIIWCQEKWDERKRKKKEGDAQ